MFATSHRNDSFIWLFRPTWEPSENLEDGSDKTVKTFNKAMGWSKMPRDDAIYTLPGVSANDEGDVVYTEISQQEAKTVHKQLPEKTRSSGNRKSGKCLLIK